VFIWQWHESGRGNASRAREALPLFYYYRSPVSQRLTARCCAGGARRKDLSHIFSRLGVRTEALIPSPSPKQGEV